MELPWREYQSNVHDAVKPEAIAARADAIRAGGKFTYSDGAWSSESYPGIAIVSMVDGDQGNDGLPEFLRPIREELGNAIAEPDAIYCLPAASHHQTLANTFSNARYTQHVVQPGLQEAFPQLIAQAFDAMPGSVKGGPIELRLIGLSIFQTCVALVADVPNTSDYDRILAFRDGIYESVPLKEISLERTRPFLGHVTLAYFGRALTNEETKTLVHRINELNRTIAKESPTFVIAKTAPRWYDDLASFHARDEYPSFSFLRD